MTPGEMARIHAASFVTPRPWSEAELSSFLADPAIIDTQVEGGFAIGRVILDEAELLTIAVDPAVRRRGLGRLLLNAFLTRATARGAASIHLEVAEDNTSARSLYASAGFAETGRRKGYYHTPDGRRIDALILRLDAAQALTGR